MCYNTFISKQGSDVPINEKLLPISSGHELLGIFYAYLAYCSKKTLIDEKGKLVEKNTPNFSGFCSFAGYCFEDFNDLKIFYPNEVERILSRLEDEALNSQLSSSIVSSYLKKISNSYLDNDSGQKNVSSDESAQIKIVFEHDALTDGA